MSKEDIFSLFIGFCFIWTSSLAKNIGDSCIMNGGKENGFCTYISNCSKDLFGPRDSLKYTKCDTENFFIICCPERFFNSQPTTTSKAFEIRMDGKRISEQKCEEYSSAVYVEFATTSLVAGAPNVISRKQQCRHKTQSLVVGGVNAGLYEFPHMALLGYVSRPEGNIDWDCAGSLISDEYVLTAAHCLTTKAGLEKVRLGELDYTSKTDGATPKDYRISSMISHPKYDPDLTYNDIAIIRLTEKVILTPEVRPACLPKSADIKQRMIATGWGKTEFAGVKSSYLQKVVLEKFTRNECSRTYQINSLGFPRGLQSSQYCAGHKTESRDTCDGDSGGPIQDYHTDLFCMYTLYGITSLGQGCGTIGVPGLYMHIYSYIDWIESVVW
ncbi:CLIPC1 family protein [Megaselia abdita]